MYDKSVASRNFLDKLGITALLNRPGVTEVLINRPGEIFIEDNNGFERFERPDLTLAVLMQLANALAIMNHKHISEKEPTHSVTLPDGERGHIMIPPACEADTIVFALRKPSQSRFSLRDYIDSGRLRDFADTAVFGKADAAGAFTLPEDVQLADYQLQMLKDKAAGNMQGFFQAAVENRLNICMVGGTGSGKTTFTKALVDLIGTDTRILTIEDTHELSLPRHANHAHLFYDGIHTTAKDIIAACMRLKPDRILLTELRGDEAWDYLSALNTGHPGGLTSVHANDCRSAYYRIAQLAKESAAGQSMEFNYILNTVKATIDVACFFRHTRMTELYFDPVEKFYAMGARR